METPEIIAYINPHCPWSPGVVAVLKKYGLSYDARDITSDASAHEEMVKKSRQYASPCVEINGHMLADVGGDEVETWLREQGFAPK
ncbi:MAG: glutaredoxin family protein [Candidatus Latescibacterota bacterium]|jgi:monothiol glutaredoxin